ncbi:MAG: response regulator transcription factor [Coprococcus sp.]|nr:response regulator transcription factor [Coprococcus sp.]
MEDKKKVLIVDDEADIRQLLNIYLRKNGYDVLEAANGMQAIDIVKENSDIDLVVMDIMMPGISGIDACKAIREFSAVPVMFLTAKTQEPVQEQAYGFGGDDFLGKPFTQEEFNRKVNALIRRYNVYRGKEETNMQNISVGNISIDTYKRIVTKNGETIKLTDKEYALLAFLVENRGKSWSLEALYENIWQEKYLPSSSNTVMVHVLRLRQKIEDNPAQPDIIRTIYGKGYQVD